MRWKPASYVSIGCCPSIGIGTWKHLSQLTIWTDMNFDVLISIQWVSDVLLTIANHRRWSNFLIVKRYLTFFPPSRKKKLNFSDVSLQIKVSVVCMCGYNSSNVHADINYKSNKYLWTLSKDISGIPLHHQLLINVFSQYSRIYIMIYIFVYIFQNCLILATPCNFKSAHLQSPSVQVT